MTLSDRLRSSKTARVCIGSPIQPTIHEVWESLSADEGRLQLVIADVCSCVEQGRAPLVLADRKAYLDRIEAALDAHPAGKSVSRFRLESCLGKKARREIRKQIDEHYSQKRPFVLLATASLVGEGFDLPQLDTLRRAPRNGEAQQNSSR